METKQSVQTNKFRNWMKMSLRQTVALVLTLLVMGGSMATAMAASIPDTSTVIDGDKVYSVMAKDTDTEDLLEAADVLVGKNDIIVRDEQDGVTLTVKRPVTATVLADGKTLTVNAYTGDTFASVLEQAGVTLQKDDVTSIAPEAPVLAEQNQIQVTRMYHVYATDNGIAKGYLVSEGTVAQAMATTDVALGEDDYFSNSEEPVKEGMVIGINRVTYQEVKKEEVAPYSVVKQNSNTLYKGSTEVKNKGVNGTKEVTYREKLVNGEVVSTEAVGETIRKAPVDQVVLVGTKPKPSSVATGIQVTPSGTLVDGSGNRISYSKKIQGSCTAYTGGGITSTGKAAAVGRVAVNPNVIPYGSKLYICSPDGSVVYGYAVAADTGGALMSGRVLADLYMNSEQECINFGRRQMVVYVLS